MKDKAKLEYFSRVFTSLLEEWKRTNHKTQEDFIELVGVASVNSVTDWKKGKTFPKKETLKKICDVFGVSEDVFTPQTHDDKYKFSSEFTTELANTRIKEFCDEEGIDLEFLYMVRKMFGDEFGRVFPFWTPLIFNKRYLLDGKYYVHENVSIYATSAPMNEGNDVFQAEIEIEKNGEAEKRLIILTYPDLRFLRDLQEEVRDFLEYRFHKRKNDLKREEERATKKSERRQKDGGLTHVRLTGEEMSQIDRYAGRYVDTEKGVEIEI